MKTLKPNRKPEHFRSRFFFLSAMNQFVDPSSLMLGEAAKRFAEPKHIKRHTNLMDACPSRLRSATFRHFLLWSLISNCAPPQPQPLCVDSLARSFCVCCCLHLCILSAQFLLFSSVFFFGLVRDQTRAPTRRHHVNCTLLFMFFWLLLLLVCYQITFFLFVLVFVFTPFERFVGNVQGQKVDDRK